MADLTQEDLQAISDLTCEQLQVKVRPHIHYRRLRSGGRASYRTGYASVPRWAADWGEVYLVYYTLHEVAHHIHRETGWNWSKVHSSEYKAIEDKVLALWGLKIERMKAYPKHIYHNGQLAFTNPRHR